MADVREAIALVLRLDKLQTSAMRDKANIGRGRCKGQFGRILNPRISLECGGGYVTSAVGSLYCFHQRD